MHVTADNFVMGTGLDFNTATLGRRGSVSSPTNSQALCSAAEHFPGVPIRLKPNHTHLPYPRSASFTDEYRYIFFDQAFVGTARAIDRSHRRGSNSP